MYTKLHIVLAWFILVCTTSSESQIRRDGVWCFGDSCRIDFNQIPPQVGTCAIRARGTACSISDTLGNLQFYSQTYYLPLWQTGYDKLGAIWNKDNVIMENGDSLVGDGWYHEMQIVPSPGFCQQYYLFHTGVTIHPEFYYSLIDLSYNAGLGKIVQKNVLMNNLNGDQVTDGIVSIPHGNGRDWWVLFRTWGGMPSNAMHRYLISPSGISGDTIENIGSLTSYGFLRLFFNNSGDKLAIVGAGGLIELFDFDRCTGDLSNFIHIHSDTFLASDFFTSAAFSPDDSKLYVCVYDTLTKLIQYDLSAPNVPASQQLISSFNYPVYGCGTLKTAPDGKIYWTIRYDSQYPFPDSVYNSINMNLSVITDPNQAGVACNFQPYSLYLGGHRTNWGLCDNPNYDLGPLQGSACDSLTNGIPAIWNTGIKPLLHINPNPVNDIVYLNAEGMHGRTATIQLTNMLGEIVFQKEEEITGIYISATLHLASLHSGMYSIRVETEKEILKAKIVKE